MWGGFCSSTRFITRKKKEGRVSEVGGGNQFSTGGRGRGSFVKLFFLERARIFLRFPHVLKDRFSSGNIFPPPFFDGACGENLEGVCGRRRMGKKRGGSSCADVASPLLFQQSNSPLFGGSLFSSPRVAAGGGEGGRGNRSSTLLPKVERIILPFSYLGNGPQIC